MSVVMGLGFTFYSGAVEAWLVDALHHSGYAGQLDRVFARGAMVSGVAMVTGTIAGGLLGDLDLAFPYLVRTLLLMSVFIVAWRTMHDSGFTPRAVTLHDLPREMRAIGRASLRYGWRQRQVKLLMLVSFLQFGFMSWGFYAWQPYFLELLGRDAVWVAGFAASALAGATIAGNAIVDWLSRFCGRRSTLLFWSAGAFTAAAAGAGLTDSFWVALGLMVVLAGAMGVSGPVKQAFLQQITPAEQRASVVSLDSMIGNGGGVAGQSGLGWLARAHSIELGYVTGGLATVLAIPLYWALRRVGGAPDHIIGAKAGASGPCAAQGIPEVAGVDARAHGYTPA